MYVPAHFEESSQDVLHDLMVSHPLGILITNGASGLDANHIPFDLDRTKGENGTLYCHVARNNPVWRDIATGDEVLVVFRAADAYISPNWYPSKHETHRLVPTWNYEVVHAHGRLRLVDDEKFVRGIVARLTRRHEAPEPQPWKMGQAPADYLDQMLRAIVGVEIEVLRLECKRKLSQNREARDVDGAVQALQERGQAALSSAMAEARR